METIWLGFGGRGVFKTQNQDSLEEGVRLEEYQTGSASLNQASFNQAVAEVRQGSAATSQRFLMRARGTWD